MTKKKTTTPKKVAGRFGAARPVVYAPVELTAYGEKRYRIPIREGEVGPFIGARTKAVILDIDGTVESWGAGLNSQIEKWLKKHYDANHTFVVITARDQWMYETSFNSMMRILPYPFVGPFLRPGNDRRFAAEYKRELAEMLSGHYEFVGAADDEAYVLKMWRQWAIDHFDNPKDFDIFEAGYGDYKDWRKDLPRKGTGYGGASWKGGTTYGALPSTGYLTPKNRPAGNPRWSGEQTSLNDDPAWQSYFSATAGEKVTRGDDEFDDMYDQKTRNDDRFDLEDDVLASYPELRMADVVAMDTEELREKKAAAIPLDVDEVTAEIFVELGEKPATKMGPEFEAAALKFAQTVNGKPRKNRVLTDELLAEVAAAYLNAPPGGRQAAVGKVLGIDAHRASYYIYKARERGLLDPPTGDMRVEEIA
jgi:hypothetical protein